MQKDCSYYDLGLPSSKDGLTSIKVNKNKIK